MHGLKPDRLDLRILAALSEDGRDAITHLAKRVALSSTPLHARVERMESAGIIQGYRAEIDIERLAGYSPYCVTLALVSPTASLLREVEALIVSSPYIVHCEALHGPLHFIFWLYARSVQHYVQIMEPFRAYELDYTTFPVSRRVAAPNLQKLMAGLARAADR